MKLSELMAKMEKWKQIHENDDPDVVVGLRNPSMGGKATTIVTGAWAGGDWNDGKYFLETDKPVCVATEHVSTDDLEKKAESVAHHTHEALGFEYAKRRRDAWKDGFIEGAKYGSSMLIEKNK